MRIKSYLALICLPFVAATSAQTAFTVCYEAQPMPPYQTGQDEGSDQRPGFLVELIAQAVRQAGLEPSFYRNSWKRCIQDLRSGRTDSIFAMIWTSERDTWAHFPKTPDGQLRNEARLWDGVYRVFVHRDTDLSWNGEQFRGLSFGIGAPLGYVAYQRLEEMDALSLMTTDTEGAFTLIARRRMDGYVIDQSIGEHLIGKLKLDSQLTYLPEPFMQSTWFLPISNRFYQAQPELAEQVWQQLQQVREAHGQSILDSYLKSP